MKKNKIADLIICILAAELVGVLSALITGSFTDFFAKFTEPPLLPPAILFPIVWSVLYALMGISAFLIHTSESAGKKCAPAVYWLQLAVNFSWSIVFFRFEQPLIAAVIISALFVLISAMLILFARIRPAAALLNIPYLLWTAFAAYLNIATVIVNS